MRISVNLTIIQHCPTILRLPESESFILSGHRTCWGFRSAVRHLLETEIRCWDLLGGHVSFSLESYLRVLRHERTLLFLLLSMLAFVASDPSGARPYVPLWFSIGFWPVSFAFYIMMKLLGLTVAAALTHYIPRLRIPLPIVGFLALIPTVMLCEASVRVMSNGTFPYDFVGQLVFYFFSVQGLETVFYRFIMPESFIVSENEEELENQTTGRHLIVGGEKVDLSGLLHIEAREHHVHLTFENETSVARARLGDIVAQTQTEDGMQPHRSWWVARDPAIRAERKNGRLVLRLRDDTEVPVARTRTDDVIAWLQTHVNPAE